MEDINPNIQRAHILLEQGRPRDAEKQLTEALQSDPENHYVLSLLAKCKLDLREFDGATALIESAIKQAPTEDYYFYLYAFTNYQQDKNGKALIHLQKACALNPYASAYFGLWAMILIEEKQFEAALVKADEGLALDAEELTCLNARATALNKLKRVDDAVITMHHALKQDPTNEFTHTTVGWNYLEKGKHRDAVDHFKEALRLNPTLESARTGLKEALKSKVAPYRWLLKYNFWITNKSKNARWIVPISVFVAVRIFAGASSTGNGNWKIVGGIVLGLYLLLVITSWVINPLANFFLLFDKDGKYAVSNNEKWNALSFTGAIVLGLMVVIASIFMTSQNDQSNGLLTAGLILMSVAIPLGHMRYPWKFKGSNFLQWYSMALVITGFITAIFCSFSNESLPAFAAVYLLGFAAYMWVHAFSRR
ncbi:tetratricopeptide repeat protein [Flavitalea sp.]|nr:tetratricopeptide repeat protein [Flavitalea sp.]